MLYDLSLHMGYIYDVPASGARHIMRLLPLSLNNRQRLIAGSLKISPHPDEQSNFTDFFQHPTTSILVRNHHEKLDIRMQARVQVESQPVAADFSPVLAKLPDEISDCWTVDSSSPHHFLGISPRLPETPEIADYARQWATTNLTVMQIAHAVCTQIHKDFTYDAKATTVETTPKEAFRLKRGVCQDFTHVMIIALRSLGIPAGYVSGFLRTIPPPGKERLEGADAMHAWVRVWCGETAGWIELDPTNNIPAGTDHIVVAYGRDYSDVAPVIGVLKSYGSQKTVQAVDVIPLKQH
ncbi:transglutaminase family protein [Rhizobium rhizogenes]|uniref:transglutaminase family protein n=1 Tax=Rhizobium rhizogenes TaxID=359 RepID=UPI00080FB22E|nr:transglutaminase family protein [Rhizobium rhizogenes]OCI92134.1 transglutaminase [Agrobacterium sp. 13-626]MDJ1636391.1 transglutaminase family protein [Rhizobium rhizogenes]NTG01542.1 transglutaminase family protein [Rhizobium rhizogenes]NTG28519.1 transglutaminase family protein [Rhizobium rhizogenes]NTG42237.1 transglutaminase family protein [Rhizobium rhizogenes]